MALHKLILRLDFEPNFEIVDSTGKILRLLHDRGEGKHWPDLGEVPEKHQVTGKNFSKDEGWLASISIDPVAISGYLESLEGIPLEKIGDSPPVQRLFKIVNLIRQKFSISNFKRTGLRFFLFEEITDMKNDTVREVFLTFFKKEMVKALHDSLGFITDCGMAFDGANDDGIQYHLKCGPYKKGEIERYLQELHSFCKNNDIFPYKPDSNTGLIIDIDFFEMDHQLHETVGFAKWCMPLIERAINMREALSEHILSCKRE